MTFPSHTEVGEDLPGLPLAGRLAVVTGLERARRYGNSTVRPVGDKVAYAPERLRRCVLIAGSGRHARSAAMRASSDRQTGR